MIARTEAERARQHELLMLIMGLADPRLGGYGIVEIELPEAA